MDALRQSLDVPGRDACHANPAILRSVDAALGRQALHLLLGQAGVGEHANLGRDVAPVARAAELLQVLL